MLKVASEPRGRRFLCSPRRYSHVTGTAALRLHECGDIPRIQVVTRTIVRPEPIRFRDFLFSKIIY